MWHSFITCSEALKIYITYLNLEPDNIWIYSILNEQVTVTVLVLYFDSVFDPHSLSSHSCLVLQFLMWSCSFGLRTTSLGFIFWQTYFFRKFETFYMFIFNLSAISTFRTVFSLLESLVPMWLEKFWILKCCSHFYWALHNHRWFWLYSLVRIS